ncbi:MAG: DnaJ C-terminal domain-containing protein [Roseovarius sp.]
MEFKDYYKVLGVPKDASQDDIKRVFRKLARKHHPDVNTDAGADDRFKELSEAYEVLGDAEKRAAYDGLGQASPHGGDGFDVPPGWEGGYRFSDGPGAGDAAFSDFFETLFRQRAGGARAGQGSHGMDSSARVQVNIEDVYSDATRALSLRVPVMAPDGGVSLQERTISVTLPKGLVEGQHIRVPGQAGAGDLFLEISFAPHPVYRPDGRDLYMDLPIAPWEAALGGHVVLPTPDGKVDLRIPQNARSGQKLRLKGKGLPGHPPGDIYAHLVIVNPKVSTDQARQAYQQLAEAMPFDPRSHLSGG